MITRRQLAAGLGLWAAAPGVGAAQAPTVPDDLVDIATGFDPALRMIGRVRVEESGPYRFVVDTGATNSVISQELARKLRLPPGEQVDLHGIAGVERVDTVRVSRFTVGGLTTHNLQMPVLSGRRLGVDGLIGLDALDGRTVEMDFRRRRLRLYRSQRRPYQGSRLTRDSSRPGAVVPAEYRNGQLTLVSARAGATLVTAVLDSGSQATVGNSALQRLARTRQLSIPETERRVPIFSVTSQTAFGEFAILRSLRMGEHVIVNVPVVFSDLHAFDVWGLSDRPAVLIGADTMSLFSSIVFDFGRHEVVFNAGL